MNRLPFYLEITILQPLTQIMTKTVYIPLTAISNSNVSFGFNSLYLCHVGFDVFIEDTSPVPSHLLDPYTYRLSHLLPSRHGNEFLCLSQRPLRITIATWLSVFLFCFIVLHVCVFCLHVCLCTACMPSTPQKSEEDTGSLELALQMIVSYRVVARN